MNYVIALLSLYFIASLPIHEFLQTSCMSALTSSSCMFTFLAAAIESTCVADGKILLSTHRENVTAVPEFHPSQLELCSRVDVI